MKKKLPHAPEQYVATHRKGCTPHITEQTTCINAACKLRKAGCHGAEGCFGFKPKPEPPR